MRLLGLAVPALAVAPKYFFAPMGGWHSNVIHNPADDHTVEAQIFYRYRTDNLNLNNWRALELIDLEPFGLEASKLKQLYNSNKVALCNRPMLIAFRVPHISAGLLDQGSIYPMGVGLMFDSVELIEQVTTKSRS